MTDLLSWIMDEANRFSKEVTTRGDKGIEDHIESCKVRLCVCVSVCVCVCVCVFSTLNFVILLKRKCYIICVDYEWYS